MGNVTFTAHGAEGYRFLQGIDTFESMLKIYQSKFTSFIAEFGFTSWHINDGWVSADKNYRDRLDSDKIRIVWIAEHAGYSHTARVPKVGEFLVIKRDSPSLSDKDKEFDLYCYKVVPGESFNSSVYLEKGSIRSAFFNTKTGKYQFTNKPWR
jgi:hypothetical protein